MRHTCCVSAVIERLGAFLSTCVHANSSVRFRGSWYYTCCFFRKVTASGEGIETEGDMTVASDESLPRVVAGLLKLANEIAAAGKDFMGKWSTSTKK